MERAAHLPSKPSSQVQPPAAHVPWPEHRFGHGPSAQSLPVHPSSHRQRPSTQAPRPWQLEGHAGQRQAGPVKPSVHWHVPLTHEPWMHGPHSCSPHVAPLQPAKQKQWPDRQEPCALQSSGHELAAICSAADGRAGTFAEEARPARARINVSRAASKGMARKAKRADVLILGQDSKAEEAGRTAGT